MKKLLLFCISLFIAKTSISQNLQTIPKQLFSTNIGLVKLGTGDMYGLMIGMEYEKQFRPKLSWSTELATTIHDGSDLLLVKLDNGAEQDLSYRYTIAGAQIGMKLGYDLLRTNKIHFGIKAGLLARYQSSSLADDREILFPALTGYPLPVRILRNTEPQRTFAGGAILQLFARHSLKNNITIGAITGIQMDTNGDVMFPQLLLSIGKRF